MTQCPNMPGLLHKPLFWGRCLWLMSFLIHISFIGDGTELQLWVIHWRCYFWSFSTAWQKGWDGGGGVGRGASRLFRCECGSHKEHMTALFTKCKSGDDSFVNIAAPYVSGCSKIFWISPTDAERRYRLLRCSLVKMVNGLVLFNTFLALFWLAMIFWFFQFSVNYLVGSHLRDVVPFAIPLLAVPCMYGFILVNCLISCCYRGKQSLETSICL